MIIIARSKGHFTEMFSAEVQARYDVSKYDGSNVRGLTWLTESCLTKSCLSSV
jgi:hypothetical protein